jgi:hypothetical protein
MKVLTLWTNEDVMPCSLVDRYVPEKPVTSIFRVEDVAR